MLLSELKIEVPYCGPQNTQTLLRTTETTTTKRKKKAFSVRTGKCDLARNTLPIGVLFL